MRKIARLAGAAFAGWVAWRVLGPEIPVDYGSPQERPLRVTGKTVIVGEREFFYREAGPRDGHPVVLVHGWSLDGEQTFYKVIPQLAERYRVIVPDLRNHGKSDWIRGRFEVADLADEVAGVLDAVGITGATVVGYSLGGMVSQELARRRPGIVGSLVLAATAAQVMPKYRRAADWAFWFGRVLARLSTTEAAQLTTAIVARSGGLERRHRRWFYEGLRRRDAVLFYASGAAAVRFDSSAWVGSLGVPTTSVIPGRDQLIPPRQQWALAALTGGAVVEIPGARHESILSHPEVYLDAIETVVKESGA